MGVADLLAAVTEDFAGGAADRRDKSVTPLARSKGRATFATPQLENKALWWSLQAWDEVIHGS
jgi:hypothetical protein